MRTEVLHPGAMASALVVWRAGPARTVAMQALQEVGFATVDAVETALDAFAFLAKHTPRLILVDAELRPTTGLVFLRELRATTVPSRDVPAVMVSARPNETLNADARRAGADGVMFGRITPAAVDFWLSCTDPDVRVIIECKDYRGPDRRVAGPTQPPVAAERRSRPINQETLNALAEDPIVQRLAEACRSAESWAESGDPAPLEAAMAALIEAGALARQHAETGLTRGVNAALQRLQREANSWDTDPAGVIGALSALQDLAARRLTAHNDRTHAPPLETP